MTENYIFPADCRAIIDVTKPPYNVDNTGKIDCTKQLCAIVDDILRNYEKEFYTSLRRTPHHLGIGIGNYIKTLKKFSKTGAVKLKM